MAQVGQSLAGLLGRQVLDLVLELVDLGVQVVDQVEIALGDVVDDAIGDHSRFVFGPHGLSGGRRVVRGPSAGRRLAHGHDRVVREHQVDLLVVDAVFFGNRDGDQEDAEDVVAVSLERRPRLVFVLRHRFEQIERGLLEILWRGCPELVTARVEQVDPVRLCHAPRLARDPARPRQSPAGVR